MREIKIKAPTGMGPRVAQLALVCQARSVVIYQAYDAALARPVDEIKIKTSTPTAHRVVKTLKQAAFYLPTEFSISSHDIRSLESNEDVAVLTRPFCVPAL